MIVLGGWKRIQEPKIKFSRSRTPLSLNTLLICEMPMCDAKSSRTLGGREAIEESGWINFGTLTFLSATYTYDINISYKNSVYCFV